MAVINVVVYNKLALGSLIRAEAPLLIRGGCNLYLDSSNTVTDNDDTDYGFLENRHLFFSVLSITLMKVNSHTAIVGSKVVLVPYRCAQSFSFCMLGESLFDVFFDSLCIEDGSMYRFVD